MDGEFVFDTKITVRSLKEKNNRKAEGKIIIFVNYFISNQLIDVFTLKLLSFFYYYQHTNRGNVFVCYSLLTESNSTLDLACEPRATSSSPVQMYNTNSAFAGVRSLPGTPQYHSSSPVTGAFAGWNGASCPPHTR